MKRLFFSAAVILSITFETLTITWLRITSLQARRTLRRWQRRLGLTDYAGHLEATHPMQVTGPDGVPGWELVGVVVDGDKFRVKHTRGLTEHDVIHELLHVLWPEADHRQVEEWTELLSADPAMAEQIARQIASSTSHPDQPSPVMKEYYP